MSKVLEEILRIGKSSIENFQLNNFDLKVYKTLIKYFYGDADFEKLNSHYSLNKGIFLHGNIGTGKSRVFEIFSEFTKKYLPEKKFHVVKTSDIADAFYANGLDAIHKHGLLSFKMYDSTPDITKPITKCYDDLGVEPKLIKSYGNERNVMADILLKRYDLFTKYEMKTFISTNYNADDIEANYGDRVRSRLREMCNDIVYEGTDRRR
ncbi:MAG: ATPase [Bacteroidetes bacterium]|nr:ATPase [Bacteroidota bacterium]